jgi:hypothetical protein
MFVNGESARLMPHEDKVLVTPSHWRLAGAQRGAVQHIPTGNWYEVTVAADAEEKKNITIFDLCARLYWIPEGGIVPSRESQVEFCQAAIAVFMVEKKLWKPRIVDRAETRDDGRAKWLARGLHL